MPTRRRLSTGIYEDRYGRSVVYSVHGRPKETRFPPDTPLERLIRWRKTQLGQAQELAPREPRGTLARDAVRFLKTRKGRPNYITEKANLKAWITALNNPPRWKIQEHHIEATLAAWRQIGYSQETLRKRFLILRMLYRKLDGPRAATPFDHLKPPAKTRPRPVSVADADIVAVAQQLRKQEITKRLHDGKTRARFLVLATHEQRPAELKRTRPEDVDLERQLWWVRGAKGGYHTIVPLNEEQLAAWRLFITANAWGKYDTRNFTRTIQRNGWPKGIRVYCLRHSTGFALSARGVDLGDIQALYGHTSPETTRIYVPGQMQRLQAAHRKLDGRFGPMAFLPRPTTTIKAGLDAKGRDSTRKTTGPIRVVERLDVHPKRKISQ